MFAVSVFGVFPARCIGGIVLFLLLYHYNFIFIRPRSYPREVQTIVTRCFIVNLEPVHWCDADCTDALIDMIETMHACSTIQIV